MIRKPRIKNGQRLKDLDVSAKIVKERTYVPLRFIAKAFGAKVEWVDKESLVRITLNAGSDTTPAPDTGSKFTDTTLKKIESIAREYGATLYEGSSPEK